ncbi:MAG: HD domain-containing protein [Oscillospiraceae bacterium]|nr:HD domain-containing protein [Oscillospiraceae bacterium]
MTDKIDALTAEMISYFSGDAKRIQHFLKVHAFSEIIGKAERLDEHTLFILEAAALVHDIGIKPAERLYGSCGGKLQEELGPSEARPILEKLAFSEEDTARICFLISRHHTYTDIDGIDLQILIEADFLVNLYEDKSPPEAVLSAYRKVFSTKTGKELCRKIYGEQIFE